MKHSKLLAVAVAVALASAAAYAQTATTAPSAGNTRIQLDANKDGRLSPKEFAAGKGM